jgi:hypothetical protein
MHPSTEISIDLTAQELLTPPAPTGTIQVDDICDIDPLLRTGSFVANAPHAALPDESGGTAASAEDDSVEIELTAEQIDALLSETGAR